MVDAAVPALDEVASEVLVHARREAEAAQFDFVGVAHLLIALLKVSPLLEEPCAVAGVQPRALRAAIRTRLGKGASEAGVTAKTGDRLAKLLARAGERAERRAVTDADLIAVLPEERDGIAADVVRQLSLHLPADQRPRRKPREPAPGRSSTPMLDKLGRDLSALAARGELPAFVGRQELLKRVLVVLARQSKPNVVLTGEAGVGKTAVVEGLAMRIAEGKVAPAFKGMRIIAIPPAAIAAGASLAGETERRLQQLVAEASSDPDIVLFFDEMHTIMGVGGSSMTAADVLKPALARGDIRVIGATTPAEFTRFLERDSATVRRFERVEVPEPTADEALEILQGARERLEAHHDVTISPEALAAAVQLSVRYLPARRLPDKALDLVDEACGRTRFRTMNVGAPPRSLVIDKRAIAEAVAERAGIPIEELSTEERKDLADLRERVEERIIGQSVAVAEVCRAVQRARVGLKPEGRPVGTFLLTGPSGVGKTLLAETLGDLAFGGAMLRIDLSEYRHPHEVSRLVGAPPGYVGHDRDGVLTGWLKRSPHAVVLFDEADKAHPSVFDILLQVIDSGRITDGRGETVDASQALFLLTSNHLASASGPKRALGFGREAEVEPPPQDAARDALQGAFRPEFLGRLDGVLRMGPLEEGAVRRVAQKLLDDARRRLERLRVILDVGEGVLEALVATVSPAYGARPMRAAVERDILGVAGDFIVQRGAPLELRLTVNGSGGLELTAKAE